MRLIAEMITQLGADPACAFDSDVEVAAGLQLTGWKTDFQKRTLIGPAEVDTAIAIPDAIALIVYSDQPVSMRLTGGEVLMPNGRLWTMMADDEDDAILPARDLLFSGNTTTEANVFVWVIEKP
tara:strand:- start:550 stop:921 length:372 start_codon:yes stop_codon:yes gene_type:complete